MFTRKHMMNASRPCASGADRAAGVELLEGRWMLAAHPLATAVLDGSGALVVTGTNKADHITVSLNHQDATKLDVTCNGTTTTFDLAAVTGGVRVSGGNGRDDISVDGGVSLHAELHGGNGGDKLAGGAGDDLLDGGNGSDDLDGGAGNDDLRGGRGSDQLAGDVGDDGLHGDSGSDDLDGEDGDDLLEGGSGRDHCVGGLGADSFDGDDRDSEHADMEADDSELLTLAQVPAGVRDSFNSLFGNVTVNEVEAEQENAGLQYKFEFTNAGGLPGEVTLDASGTVLV